MYLVSSTLLGVFSFACLATPSTSEQNQNQIENLFA